MRDVRLDWLWRTQADLVAGWQLRALGWTERQVEDHAHRHWTAVHCGVFARARAPLTQRQRWFAAVLTAPGTVLSHASAAVCWGFVQRRLAIEIVSRPGSGGPRHHGRLLVYRSTTLAPHVEWHQGLPITSAARALADLAPHLAAEPLARAFREALRLRATTIPEIERALERRRGTAALADLCRRYAHVPYRRTRSDAEGRALERYADAGMPLPAPNVRINGFEADLVDEERRLIVEIDGPQFHLFADQDEERERAWRARGYDVARRPSGAVYGR